MTQIMDVPNVFVLGVEQKPTRTGGVRYLASLSDGSKPSTFDPNVANKAMSFNAAVAQAQGQQPTPVTVRVELKPNPSGGQPYRNLVDIAGPGEQLLAAPVQAPGVGMAIPAAGGIPAIPAAIPAAAPSGGGGGRGMSPEDVARITRLSALSSATAIVASLFEGAGDGVDVGILSGKSIQLAEAFVQYGFTGLGPAGQVVYPAGQQQVQTEQVLVQQPQQPIQPQATTPEGVQAYVQQQGLPAGVVQVGVPVAQPQQQVQQQPQQGPSEQLPAWLGGQQG